MTEPVLENDYWRYLWDGRVLAHGINPYLYAPLDHVLDFLDMPYRHWIGWSQFRTIYPPLSELLFTFMHLLSPDSLFGLKVMFGFFDMGTGVVLILWLKNRNVNPVWSLLYFLSPLVLKEIANSAHLDSIAVFFSTAAIYVFSTKPRRRTLSWVLLALGTAAKLYPILLVPLFFKIDVVGRKKNSVLFLAILALLYAPFFSAGTKLFSGANAFGTYWIFNAGLFQIVTLALNSLLRFFSIFGRDPVLMDALRNDFPAKLLLGFIFIFGVFWKTKKLKSIEELPRAALWVLGLFLMVSPVVDSWYVLWLLPLACLLRNIPWLVFSYLVLASYSWIWSKQMAPYFRTAEYLVFFLVLILWNRKNVGQTHNLIGSPHHLVDK